MTSKWIAWTREMNEVAMATDFIAEKEISLTSD